MEKNASAKAVKDRWEPDIFGSALLDFFKGRYTEDITVHSSIAQDDVIPLPYLFRNYDSMPPLEQYALGLTAGKTLDIGACAGSHSLYLQDAGIRVTALDQSPGAVEVMTRRGLTNVTRSTFLNFDTGKFDTILLLMNGTGIFEHTRKISRYLEHLKRLLRPGGQLLIDSTDIHYMFEEDDGSYWVDTNRDYYGEVTFQVSYKGRRSRKFDWLYLDFDTLKSFAEKNGFKAELLKKGMNFEYLARLILD